MKTRLFIGYLFLSVASAAVMLYFGKDKRNPDMSSAMTAHGSGSTLVPANGAVGDRQHEERMLAAALEKNPDHAPVLFKLAQIEAETGRLQEASTHLRRILRTEPDNPEANLELGKICFRLGDIQGAVESTERILKTRPDYEDALYNLGAIYANTGNREKAKEYWNRLTALNSDSEIVKMAQQMMNRLEINNP